MSPVSPVTADALNMIAWRDFILWAWKEPEMREQFTAKTGVDVRLMPSLIGTVIDAASGANASAAVLFVEWVTREHWGIEHAPAAYRKKLTDNEVQRA